MSFTRIFAVVVNLRYTFLTPILLFLQFMAFPPGSLLNQNRLDISHSYLQEYSVFGILQFIAIKIKALYLMSALTLPSEVLNFFTILLILTGFYAISRYVTNPCRNRALFVFLIVQIMVMLIFALLKLHPIRSKYFPIITIINAILIEKGLHFLWMKIKLQGQIRYYILNIVSIVAIALTFSVGIKKYKKYNSNFQHNTRLIQTIKQQSDTEIRVDKMALVVFAYYLKSHYSDFQIVSENASDSTWKSGNAKTIYYCLFLREQSLNVQMQKVSKWLVKNPRYRLENRTCFSDSSYLVVKLLRE
ncbi:MAG: hypothetical protein DWQ10_09915 [Calditrichaeota bacterium]|nr:MAG: hypothetical protein DWQ10_09915 [Calditrichota bacterium]